MEVMSRTPPLSPPEPEPEPKANRFGLRHALDVAAICIFVALVGAVVWFIHRYAVNALYDDQWTDINVIRQAHEGTLSFGSLWAQHNENRILFPNLIVLALAYTTHFDLVVEDYLSGVFWILTAGLLIAAHKRRSPSIPLILYCPVAIVLLLFVPLGDVLFSYQMSWYLVLLGLAGAIFFLDRPVLSRPALVTAVGFAVVGSYSSMEGLFIWPAGFVLLYLRRRSRGPVIAWVAAACVTWALYFVDFDFASAGGQKSYVLNHPVDAVRYFISSVGNVTDAFYPNNSPTVGNNAVFVLGVLVLTIAVWALVRGFRPGRDGGGPVGVALICFGLIFLVFITVGRAQLGLPAAERYSIFTLLIWVGAYFALLEPPPEGSTVMVSGLVVRADRLVHVRRTEPNREGGEPRPALPWLDVLSLLALVGLVFLFGVQVLMGTSTELSDAAAFHNQELTMIDVTANIDRVPDSVISSVLGSYPPSFIRQMASVARSERLSLFDTPLAAEDSRVGLFPSFDVAVIRPPDGSVVSGSVLLDASVAISKSLTAVEFRVTGEGLHGAHVGTGRQTLIGWLDYWDTHTVSNGIYQLVAVLVYHDRATATSNPIELVVRN